MLLAAFTVGCGDGRIETYPVSGKVLVRGKPAEGAEVIFFPKDESLKGQAGTPIPKGKVGADGSFSLTSFEAGDGAPAGEYAVTVVWLEVARDNPDPELVVERDRLGGQYAEPETSGLTATVAEGENQLPPFELQ